MKIFSKYYIKNIEDEQDHEDEEEEEDEKYPYLKYIKGKISSKYYFKQVLYIVREI